ncbi:hypothetical protein PSPO01_05156 [Paraphaeosphaeria sporulosa]
MRLCGSTRPSRVSGADLNMKKDRLRVLDRNGSPFIYLLSRKPADQSQFPGQHGHDALVGFTQVQVSSDRYGIGGVVAHYAMGAQEEHSRRPGPVCAADQRAYSIAVRMSRTAELPRQAPQHRRSRRSDQLREKLAQPWHDISLAGGTNQTHHNREIPTTTSTLPCHTGNCGPFTAVRHGCERCDVCSLLLAPHLFSRLHLDKTAASAPVRDSCLH